MHVYRNRRYEEEIVMLIGHKKGEQRMIETHKQKTRIQAHHNITDSATQTHLIARTTVSPHLSSGTGAESL